MEKNKSGMFVTGTVWAINEYVNKDTGKVYHSIDLAVKGLKQMLNVKLPDGYNRATIKEDSDITIRLSYRVNNYSGKISPEFALMPE